MSNETACVTRRTKGDGTIFQNKKGRWIARYKRKGFPPKEFSGKTRAEAQAKMDEYKFLVFSGNLVNHLLPLEEYAVKFLNYKSKQVNVEPLNRQLTTELKIPMKIKYMIILL